MKLQFQHNIIPDLSVLADVQIRSLEQIARRAPFPEEERARRLVQKEANLSFLLSRGAIVSTALYGEDVVGYVLYRRSAGAEAMHAYDFYTTEVQELKHMGKQFLQELARQNKGLVELTLESTPGALQSHKNNGFIDTMVGICPYYMRMPAEHIAKWRNAPPGEYPVFTV